MKCFKALAICLSLFGSQVYGANERGNGGDVAVGPQGDVRFLDLVREPSTKLINLEAPSLLPALERKLQSLPDLDQLTLVNRSQARNFQAHLLNSIRSMRFYLVSGPLPEINDRGVVVLSWGSGSQRIERLAYQSIANRTIIVDRDYYARMPAADRPAFLAHEGLIRLYYDDTHNPSLLSTEKISNFVNEIFTDESLPLSHVNQYLCDIGIMTSTYDYAGYQEVIGILTPLKYPQEIVVTFRENERCHSYELVRNGPTKYDRVNSMISEFDERFKWEFQDKHTGRMALIGLFRGQWSALLEFYVETEIGGITMVMRFDHLYDSRFSIWAASNSK